MLSKFVGSLRGIGGHRTGFDLYLTSVQGRRGASSPTMDEARRDFSQRIRSEFQGYLR